MIVGRENLKKLFPNFADDVQENGIDLRVGELYCIDECFGNMVGCIDDKKYLPKLVKLDYCTSEELGDYYELQPKNYYFVKVDRDIKIPNGYTQTYLVRSTFARSGLILISSVGDNGFDGTLMMGLYNSNNKLPILIGKNERIIQAVTYENDGTASEYDGSYQNNKAYK